jgi:hypothetical protein
MRYRALGLTLGLAACSGGLLKAVTEPPSGLSVSVSSTFVPGIVPTSGSIFGKGDSVVAIISRPAVCGKTLSADAGTVDAGLVVTVVLTSEGVQSCAPLNGMTTYRAVVHGVPSGSYDASAHVRLAGLGGNSDTTVARATIPLPQ